MKEKKQLLIYALMPTPIEWFAIVVIFLFLQMNPYHIVDRVFALAEKDSVYGIVINIAAFLACVPYYLRVRKKLRKYQEDKWDDK